MSIMVHTKYIKYKILKDNKHCKYILTEPKNGSCCEYFLQYC